MEPNHMDYSTFSFTGLFVRWLCVGNDDEHCIYRNDRIYHPGCIGAFSMGVRCLWSVCSFSAYLGFATQFKTFI